MKLLFTLISLLASTVLSAQTKIDPRSNDYNFNMEAFNAEYAQMGSKLTVVASISSDGEVYNVSMSMPDLTDKSRLITDVIGISAEDGSFIYRDFHLPFPAWTFNRVKYADGKIEVEAFSASEVVKNEQESPSPVFDGTFAYWQLGGVNQSVESFVLNRWKQTPKELVVGLSTVPFVRSEDQELVVDNETYACRVYTVEVSPGTKVICYVADQAPYLIKQEYKVGEGNTSPVLELSKVWK